MHVIYSIRHCTSRYDEETARVTALWLKITGGCASVISQVKHLTVVDSRWLSCNFARPPLAWTTLAQGQLQLVRLSQLLLSAFLVTGELWDASYSAGRCWYPWKYSKRVDMRAAENKQLFYAAMCYIQYNVIGPPVGWQVRLGWPIKPNQGFQTCRSCWGGPSISVVHGIHSLFRCGVFFFPALTWLIRPPHSPVINIQPSIPNSASIFCHLFSRTAKRSLSRYTMKSSSKYNGGRVVGIVLGIWLSNYLSHFTLTLYSTIKNIFHF